MDFVSVNIAYIVLSRGLDQPERFPNAGEVISLVVQPDFRATYFHEFHPDAVHECIDSVYRLISLGELEVVPEYVHKMGSYASIKGYGSPGGDGGRHMCKARYEVGRQYPAGTPIGDIHFSLPLIPDSA